MAGATFVGVHETAWTLLTSIAMLGTVVIGGVAAVVALNRLPSIADVRRYEPPWPASGAPSESTTEARC